MPDWPLLGDGQIIENAGANTAASRGTSVAAHASANTKGAYVQLIAATARDSQAILVMIDDVAAGVDYLIDLAIGAAASEQVIVGNLYAGAGTGSISYGAQYCLLLSIPAATRVSARCQATTGGSTPRISCLLFAQGFLPSSPFGLVETYGAATGDSGGSSINPGAVANTKGAYTEIIASTTYPISAVILAFGNQINTVRSSQSWLVDLAIGAAASETVILPNLALNASTSPDTVVPQTYGPLPVSIPAGSRIAARAQSDGTDATDRQFDLIVYALS
jgi:microcompartment protein CcmK/EutM